MCPFWPVGVLFVIVGLLTPATTARHPADEGCVAMFGASCSYVAHRKGGVEAVGNNWSVEIVRGERHIHLGPRDLTDAVSVRDVIRPGDKVTATTEKTYLPWIGIVAVGARANGG